MKNIFIAFVLGFMISTPADAWTLQEMARVSNALLVGADLTLEKKSFCKLKPEQISEASQNLKSLIDERIEIVKIKKSKVVALRETCQKDCTCDVYDYALEKLEVILPDEPVLFTPAQRLACFKKVKNLCRKQLFKALVK